MTYTITAYNSQTTGTLNVTFDDDAPTATDEGSQNVAEGATVPGQLDFVAGADGATVTHIGTTALVFDAVTGYSQVIDIGDGSIKVKADGSYSFTADDPATGPGSASATVVTDADGDTATAAVSFAVTDANTPTGGTTAASVDDDGLTGGNATSVAGDLAVPDSDGDDNEATFGHAGLQLWRRRSWQRRLCFDGRRHRDGWPGDGQLQLGRGHEHADGEGPRGVLFTVAVTPATGAYTVTLLDNVLHDTLDGEAGDDTENDATAALTYTVTDADNSQTTGTLNVTFDDDAPTATDEGSRTLPRVRWFLGSWTLLPGRTARR